MFTSLEIKALEIFRLRDDEDTDEVFIEYFELTVLKTTLMLVSLAPTFWELIKGSVVL